ncbi:MAG TPA: (2Fe-2S)-binding protein [Bacteroidia bacterium]|nr:(2Fe-2S)-binding protein [Bacteroidales bacterium]HNU49144.1 (2Fe-2S)-binding protein [Bacteroidia bacterium]
MENSEKIICNCMDVSEKEIIDAIKNHGCDTVEKVGDKTGAGTGCGGCVEEIEILIEQNKK